MVTLSRNIWMPLFAFALLINLTACKESFKEDTNDEVVFSQAMMENTVFSTANPFMGTTNNTMFGPEQQLQMIRDLVAALNLTDEQKQTTRTLTLSLFTSLIETRTAFQAQQITREQAVEQIRQARQTFMRSFSAILTPTQLTALERWKQRYWNS